ncbi:hypothetical protein BDV59DRAFT_45954 [Aspergillus ambiguus]|uniref:uncharacterized protein n=1 Tax=Aspergillus ambiguus TaxID=176160 RepID=UPI003CCC9EA1
MIYFLLMLPLCWCIPMQGPRNALEPHMQMTPASGPLPQGIYDTSQHVLQTTDQATRQPSSSHGAFVNINYTQHADGLTGHYMETLRKSQLPTTLIDRYSHELVALGLLLLVPVTLGVVELAEYIGRYYSEEEYPNRGRERQRWLGSEREKHTEMRTQREKKVYEERRWWRRCRERDLL